MPHWAAPPPSSSQAPRCPSAVLEYLDSACSSLSGPDGHPTPPRPHSPHCPQPHSEQGTGQKSTVPPSTFSFQGRVPGCPGDQPCPASLSLPAGREADSWGVRVEEDAHPDRGSRGKCSHTRTHTHIQSLRGQAEYMRFVVTLVCVSLYAGLRECRQVCRCVQGYVSV